MRILVTRPRPDADELAAQLVSRGHEVIVAPVLDIVFETSPALQLDGAQALLFTSANGVRAFAEASQRRDLPVFAVGHATAAAARVGGFASVESANGDVGDLARLVADRLKPDAGPLVHVAGGASAGDLAGALAACGFEARRAVLYRAVPRDKLDEMAAQALADGRVDVALFFSPRTASGFVRLVHEAGAGHALSRVIAIGLSPAVIAALGDTSWATRIAAARPNEAALFDALDAAARRASAAPSKGNGMTDATPSEPTPSDTPRASATPQQTAKTDGRALSSPALLIVAAVAVIAIALTAWRELTPRTPPATVDIAPLSQRIADVEKRLAAANAAASASSEAASKLAAIVDRLTSLEKRVDAPAAPAPADPALQAQVDRLETSLAERLSNGTMQIASLTAENRRLAGELARLQESVTALATTVNERLAIRRGESVILAIGQLREAANRGAPFATEIATLRTLAGDEPVVSSALVLIAPMAAKGVATRTVLRMRFEAVALEASRRVHVAGGGSWWERAIARLSGLVAIRPVGETEGDGPLARIARAETRLAADDLGGAVATLDGGDATVRDIAAMWLAEARARLALEDGLARLVAYALAHGG